MLEKRDKYFILLYVSWVSALTLCVWYYYFSHHHYCYHSYIWLDYFSDHQDRNWKWNVEEWQVLHPSHHLCPLPRLLLQWDLPSSPHHPCHHHQACHLHHRHHHQWVHHNITHIVLQATVRAHPQEWCTWMDRQGHHSMQWRQAHKHSSSTPWAWVTLSQDLR